MKNLQEKLTLDINEIESEYAFNMNQNVLLLFAKLKLPIKNGKRI